MTALTYSERKALERDADDILAGAHGNDRAAVKAWDQVFTAHLISRGVYSHTYERSYEWGAWSDPDVDLRESAMPKVTSRDSTATRALFTIEPTPWQRRMVVTETAQHMADNDVVVGLRALRLNTTPLNVALTWCHEHDKEVLRDYVGLGDDPYDGLPLDWCDAHDDCQRQQGRALFLATLTHDPDDDCVACDLGLGHDDGFTYVDGDEPQ